MYYPLEDLEIDKDELMRRECHARADRLRIPREFYEQFAQEFFDGHAQFKIPELLQAAQELYDEQQYLISWTNLGTTCNNIMIIPHSVIIILSVFTLV